MRAYVGGLNSTAADTCAMLILCYCAGTEHCAEECCGPPRPSSCSAAGQATEEGDSVAELNSALTVLAPDDVVVLWRCYVAAACNVKLCLESAERGTCSGDSCQLCVTHDVTGC